MDSSPKDQDQEQERPIDCIKTIQDEFKEIIETIQDEKRPIAERLKTIEAAESSIRKRIETSKRNVQDYRRERRERGEHDLTESEIGVIASFLNDDNVRLDSLRTIKKTLAQA